MLIPRTTTSSIFAVSSFAHGAGVLIETGPDLERHAEFLRKLDRARLHDLGTGARHLEQFVVGNLAQLCGLGHDPRIAGEDAIHVGENLARVGIQRAGQRDRGQDRSRRGRAW